jgi:hypothetical protein
LDTFSLIFDKSLDYMYIGIAIGFFLFAIRTLMVLLCKNYEGKNWIVSMIINLYVQVAARKVNKLGMQAVAYSPIIDGKKVTAKDAKINAKFDYKDPLILEQDHQVRSFVFNKYFPALFYKYDDLTIKGFFHEIGSKKVYTGSMKIIEGKRRDA